MENRQPVSGLDAAMRISTLLALALLWLSQPLLADKTRENECKAVKEEIRRIQARMRRGYSAAQGVKLDAKLLELRERRLKVCR